MAGLVLLRKIGCERPCSRGTTFPMQIFVPRCLSGVCEWMGKGVREDAEHGGRRSRLGHQASDMDGAMGVLGLNVSEGASQ